MQTGLRIYTSCCRKKYHSLLTNGHAFSRLEEQKRGNFRGLFMTPTEESILENGTLAAKTILFNILSSIFKFSVSIGVSIAECVINAVISEGYLDCNASIGRGPPRRSTATLI